MKWNEIRDYGEKHDPTQPSTQGRDGSRQVDRVRAPKPWPLQPPLLSQAAHT